jgi:hypothetical protein
VWAPGAGTDPRTPQKRTVSDMLSIASSLDG